MRSLSPCHPSEVFVSFLFLISPATLLAVERANSDLLIFLMTALFAFFLSRVKTIFSIAAGFVLYFAAALKVYPFILAIPWFFCTKGRTIRSLFLVFGAAMLSAYFFFFSAENSYFLKHYPRPLNIDSFGFKILVKLAHLHQSATPLLFMAVALTAAAMVIGLLQICKSQRVSPTISHLSKLLLFCGVSILLGCYSLNTNNPYRLIFFILLLPATFEILREKKTPKTFRAILHFAVAFTLVPMFMSELSIRFVCQTLLHAPNYRWLFCLSNQISFLLSMCIYLSIFALICTKKPLPFQEEAFSNPPKT